ncbi:MAG: CPBP family intramembrane metalloprotease [Planctomycetes bacterium]|nr:CPBP family intramembrane metalloprotease [Planctomycetota bacterium]
MSNPSARTDGFPLAVTIEGALALLAVALAWLFSVPLRDQIPPFGASLAMAVARGLVVTAPMLAVFWWLVHSDRPTFSELRRQVQRLIGEMFPSASVGQLAMVAVLAGVGEELLFRGVLQTLIGRWTTPIVGLAITSLLFGLAHAMSKVYFALATLIGLCFGWMTWYYNDLVGPMVAHGVYDFVALVYLSRRRLSAVGRK